MGNFVDDWKRGYDEMVAVIGPELHGRLLREQIEELLTDLEAEFSAGDISAPLKCVHLCVAMDIPIPAWAKSYFVASCEAGYDGKLKSWDLVFGHPYTPAKSQRGIWESHAAFLIHEKVNAAIAAGRSIDDKLFEEIGLELGIGGKTKVKRLYAESRAAAAEVKEGIEAHEKRMRVVDEIVTKINKRGVPIDDHLFAAVAKSLQTDDVAGLKELYADAQKEWGDGPTPTPENPVE